MSVKFTGHFDRDSAIPAPNTGLNKYAQSRLNNVVSRAVARHANALSVDGIYFNVWTKQLGGVPCSCCDNLNNGSLLESVPLISQDVNSNNRQPVQSKNPLNIPLNQDKKFNAFSFSTNDQAAVLSASNPNPPNQALDLSSPLDSPIDTLNRNLLLESLSMPVSDDDLARLVTAASTGAVFGGDKTKCGICFSTGYVGGYSLNGGQRLILDASFTNPVQLINGAMLDTSCHPFKFILNNKGSVQWTADLSPYTLSWLNIAVNNNLKPASNTQFQLFYNGSWQEITLGLLLQLNGTDTSQLNFRVIADPSAGLGLSDTVEFTHAEITFMLTPPLLGQAPQLPYALSYDQLEPLINTNFELLADIPQIPRETIMQDSRTNLLWMVLSVTPKITGAGQLFGYDVDVRKIASSEEFYRLILPFQLPTAPQNQLQVGSIASWSNT